MAFEQLSLAPAPVDVTPDSSSSPAVAVNGRQPPPFDVPDDSAKVPRLPRWTRQEILVLIQGKKVAENRVRRGRTAGLAFGSAQVEPKWASVSSYCKRHGVNRGPVQCRKRWSNLAGDFKKIKEWESQIREETDSFWVMRNDLRRERKLPGFFDREVYDILDGGGGGGGGGEGEGGGGAGVAGSEEVIEGLALALAPATAVAASDTVDDVEPETEVEPVFDSGRSATADDGLFSDFEHSVQDEVMASPNKGKETPATSVPAPAPISEKQFQPFTQEQHPQGSSYEKQPATMMKTETERNQEGKKRKRDKVVVEEEEDDTRNVQAQLVQVLEQNGRLLSSQLESQNIHLQLEREQRKDHVNSLISVLNKLADALGRIADKL